MAEPTTTAPTTTAPCALRTGNLIRDYYHLLPQVVARCVDDPAPVLDARSFSPGFAVPPLDARMEEFLDVAEASWRGLGEYGSHPLHLLGLAGNPGTQTTKTFASLLIVARAVEHIRRTGERVLIFSPTSANKGVALRDAVLRAITAGLVDADRLQVVTLAPAGSLAKIRASALSTDPGLRRRNPLLCYRGPQAEDVKPLGKAFVDAHAELLLDAGVRVWSTLELRNYLIADAARAFFEHEVAPSRPGDQRWHAHAVSSAFGLLGYSVGRDVVEAGEVSPRPGYLLVQHLGTPDMVLHLRHGEFDRARIPQYAPDPATGLHTQAGDPRFPTTTYDPLEVLDPTFYTRRPATSPTMDALIARHGGDGIVVSLHECVIRYPAIRHRLAEAGLELPADLRTIREWSLVMVLTGVLNAIDRGLVPAGHEVVVHGSGFYTSRDYDQIGGDAVVPVADVHDVATAVRRAAAG